MTESLHNLGADAAIELEKDKMDLRPGIKFIEEHFSNFAAGRDTIMSRQPSAEARAWADALTFEEVDKIKGQQVRPAEARELLARMPEAMIALSRLKTVTYHYGSDVIEPIYNEDGTMKTGNTVPIDEWGKDGEHKKNPTRILIGLTIDSGEKIYQSALPPVAYKNPEAAHMYQLHVLMHEFFHTIERPRQDSEIRKQIVLETNGQRFTFNEWWRWFEDAIDYHIDAYVSRYAEGYADRLTSATKESDYAEYTKAIAEQICESFVGHQLNIISNDHGGTNFRDTMPRAWAMIDTLCRAKVIS